MIGSQRLGRVPASGPRSLWWAEGGACWVAVRSDLVWNGGERGKKKRDLDRGTGYIGQTDVRGAPSWHCRPLRFFVYGCITIECGSLEIWPAKGEPEWMAGRGGAEDERRMLIVITIDCKEQ